MVTLEFYVRNESETDGRGPFTLEQLKPLAQSGEVTPATLYYEAAEEKWMRIDSNPELAAALFPAPVAAPTTPAASTGHAWTTVILLVLAVIGECLPAARAVRASSFSLLLQTHPVLYLGLLDLLLIILIGTDFARLAGFTRFRAALGFGFIGFIFWSHGQHWPVAAAALGSAGLFLSTFTHRKTAVTLAWLLGVPGMLGVMLALLS